MVRRKTSNTHSLTGIMNGGQGGSDRGGEGLSGVCEVRDGRINPEVSNTYLGNTNKGRGVSTGRGVTLNIYNGQIDL